MKIYIEWIGLLHIDSVKNRSIIEVKDNATISVLFDELQIRKDHQKYISCFINGSEKKPFSMLHPDDKVKLFLPTGGG